ncbi:hypothetical protein Enr13x_68760 [Stieleria neptunia]|uniref:Zinc-finger domain-containing protein n=1 Tax=Stieleria neptunia TaxID=2527979 RepID=A0A518I1R0_9BACT|nr:hypothetical protein [Stieleria neptunia]QDV46967.1 hypothetical protein Enr13x_68760 [Stieleria neptunia]
MRCDQFHDRLDQLLDARQDVGRDRLLCDHASHCQTCRDSLQIWSAIDDFVSPQEPVSPVCAGPPKSAPGSVPIATTGAWATRTWATAAAVLVCVAIAGRWLSGDSLTDKSESSAIASVVTDGTLAHQTPAPPGAVKSAPDPSLGQPSRLPTAAISLPTSQWWSVVSDEPWVHHTLPAVNSVRIGVAPIGRSMKQAIAILMIQSDATRIDASNLTPTIQPEPFQEQTSTFDPDIDFASLV